MAKLSRWLSAMMVDDFIHDPVLAVRVIFGYEIPPHMELRIRAMWNKTYFIDSSGYGTHKTMAIGLVSGLRAILFEGREAGIVAPTFRQGKRIFRMYDQWIASQPIFRNQIAVNRLGDPSAVHSSDVWELTAKSGSKIRVLPPNFLQDSENVASESWTDGYFEEWTRYPNYEALDRVLLGRVRKPISEIYDDTIPMYGHHWYFAGTAGRKSNPAYKKVETFAEQIAMGKKEFELQSWNYTHIGDEFKRLRGDRSRELMMASLSPEEIRMEIMGEWVDDDLTGFYTAKAVGNARTPDCPVLLRA
ncbi:MAG: hypothetical protein KIS92_02750 [Planctomycetota bacterium]|nr:hypothetical protein [Planctomycetota bacterium]